MRVFAVSGYSGTGKTTLVEEIVRELVMSGHSVATIKSSKHEAGADKGTDTFRHLQAGASMTVFLGPDTRSKPFKDRIDHDDWEELSKYDFLILEGMKSEDIPRFWCIGDEELVADEIPLNTQAIVSWSDRESSSSGDIRVIKSNKVKDLVEILKVTSVELSEIE
jgi:molybdopterin-guanine dinucleotide biosynthesis protein B